MILFQGTVWRIMFAGLSFDPTSPARAPEGRFHYDGQWAVYTSLTLNGAGVAIAGYVRDDDAARCAIPIEVRAQVIDLRALPVPTTASMVWQTECAMSGPAPTWQLSDGARDQGADGVLYPSRSRPELTHLCLFQPRALRSVGNPVCWRPAH